ncbi:MAG: efflux RND transporter periplasmic adaptor subunit [Deltaproteobacteria bacterium]|nr:efflux RND transporter periplasmic adaptor subunit [Deltaproteobacteria bacterium]MBW2359658.1 efflux RND transporter periplasmic adaptor subunit [Deltaproteobacteria bacterium]
MRWAIPAALMLAGVVLRYTVFAPDALEVRVTPVERGVVESTVTNSKAGTVKARRRSRIAAEIGGRVVAIVHREGARVEDGEVIVRLNDTTQVAQLELAREGMAVARARRQEACLRRDRAQRELERNRKLAESNVLSEDRLDALEYSYDSARVTCDGARAELAQAAAQVRSAEAELAKTLIHAPFAGVVAELNVEVGEWVTPSPPLLTSPAVVDLIDPESIYVAAPMDEVDSGAIRVGLPVKLTVDSRPDEVFAGRVSRVAPYVLDIEAQNRTLEIEVEIAGRVSGEALLPGTSADVEVVLETREEVLRVPTSALLQNQRVLVLANGKLEERSIDLGLRNWRYAEVRAGVAEGEAVVVSLDDVGIEAGARAVVAPDDSDAIP